MLITESKKLSKKNQKTLQKIISDFDNKKNYKLANIRLDWIANYIIINSALLLTDTNFENKVKQIAKALNSNKRFGKNLAYYLFYRSNKQRFL